jgi:tetratricopeptide (TPR) repeat protein
MMIRSCTHVSLGVILGICTIATPIRAEQSLSDRICNSSSTTQRNQNTKIGDATQKARDAVRQAGDTSRKADEAMQSYETVYGTMERLRPLPLDVVNYSSSGEPLPQPPRSSPKPPVTAIEFYDESIFSGERASLLNRAIALAPDFTYAYASRARMYTNRKDFDRAIADYDRLRQLDPNRESEILMAKAQIYAQKKQWAKVIQIYDKLLTLEPNFIFHHYTVKAQAYAELKDFSSTITQYSLAIALPENVRQNDKFPLHFRMWVPEFSRTATEPIPEIVGADLFRIGLSTYLTDAELYVARARFHTIQKNKSAALADYQQAIQLSKRFTGVWNIFEETMIRLIHKLN